MMQTGNLHIAIYDYANDDVYISIAARFHLPELFLEIKACVFYLSICT